MKTSVILVSLDDLRALVAEVTPAPPPSLLDRQGLAAALNVGVDTVDDLVRDGLPFVPVGSRRRFELAGVLAWLRGRGAPCPENEPANSISRKASGTRE